MDPFEIPLTAIEQSTEPDDMFPSLTPDQVRINELEGLIQAFEADERAVERALDQAGAPHDEAEYTNRTPSVVRIRRLGAKTTLRQEDWGDRLDRGRRYLMGVDAANLTVTDALKAFGYDSNGRDLE